MEGQFAGQKVLGLMGVWLDGLVYEWLVIGRMDD